MSTENSRASIVFRIAAFSIVMIMLLLMPAPILPPHRLSEAIQKILNLGWKPAYLAATILLELAFYGSLGIVAAFVVKRAETTRRRLLQIIVVPIFVIGLALIIRSVKVGHIPIWVNTVIPMVACIVGVWLGLGLLYQRFKLMMFIIVIIGGTSLWMLFGGTSN